MANTQLALKCIGGNPTGSIFLLELQNDLAILIGPNGQTAAQWTLQEAARCFAVPGLFSEARWFTIFAANGSMRFKTNSSDRRTIRRFLDSAACDLGPQMESLLWKAACRQIAAGVVMLLIAALATLASHNLAKSGNSGYLIFPLGLASTGTVALIRGLEYLRRHRAAKRIAANTQMEQIEQA